MAVGKREAGVSRKIGEKIVEEVEKFMCLGVWVDKMLRVMWKEMQVLAVEK